MASFSLKKNPQLNFIQKKENPHYYNFVGQIKSSTSCKNALTSHFHLEIMKIVVN